MQGLGFHDARHLALSMGVDPFWSAEHARTAEGYFRVAGGMELAVARANAFAPYADLLWMESSKPYISQVPIALPCPPSLRAAPSTLYRLLSTYFARTREALPQVDSSLVEIIRTAHTIINSQR